MDETSHDNSSLTPLSVQEVETKNKPLLSLIGGIGEQKQRRQLISIANLFLAISQAISQAITENVDAIAVVQEKKPRTARRLKMKKNKEVEPLLESLLHSNPTVHPSEGLTIIANLESLQLRTLKNTCTIDSVFQAFILAVFKGVIGLDSFRERLLEILEAENKQEALDNSLIKVCPGKTNFYGKFWDIFHEMFTKEELSLGYDSQNPMNKVDLKKKDEPEFVIWKYSFGPVYFKVYKTRFPVRYISDDDLRMGSNSPSGIITSYNDHYYLYFDGPDENYLSYSNHRQQLYEIPRSISNKSNIVALIYFSHSF